MHTQLRWCGKFYYSRIQNFFTIKWYKKYKNGLRLAKVIVTNKMSRFLWFSVYSVPAKETAKHRTKFGWPRVSDVAAVTKARLETRWNLPISAVNGPKFAILWGHVEELLLFNNFFRLSIHALFAKIQPDRVMTRCNSKTKCKSSRCIRA